MKSQIVFISVVCVSFLLALVWAAPIAEEDVQILKYDNDNIGVDGYNFAFETSDGVSRKETATLKNAGTENEAISVQGSVSWVSPDGTHYTLNYLADENGFQPEGDHLPVAPEA
ncbi:endocuticle structural glycoprotein SgAbd-5-like [Teleopsis dalmanni]|uniref:endocuticle structural glycoprotein SgAbd-5-like n=1 Tax=Teleopsis dalmanni TaxID=139649 RepID=UPI0018CEB742|nr:endocuticle structural glycoprotein SgAbd-5-like [Teleopsis dalmanni]